MGIPNEWLFETSCAGCGKPMRAIMVMPRDEKNRQTNKRVETVFCNRGCESMKKDRDKFHVTNYKIIPNR